MTTEETKPVMNVERMLMIAELIETMPHIKADVTEMDDDQFEEVHQAGGNAFCMATVRQKHDCGTVACIAGWTLMEYGHAEQSWAFVSWHKRAAELLGLTQQQANRLFYGQFIPKGMKLYEVTPQMAAEEMRRMVEASGVAA